MARGLNKALLIGNLGKDPEMRYTASGTAVANFNIATSRRRKDPNGNLVDDTEWHRIVVYDKLAEIAGQYLRKGGQVYIEGRIQSRQWTDQQGQTRYTTEIIASELTLLGGRGDSGGGGDTEGDDWDQTPAQSQRPQRPQAQPQAAQSLGQPARPQRQAPPQPQRPAAQEDETFASDDMDDVPF